MYYTSTKIPISFNLYRPQIKALNHHFRSKLFYSIKLKPIQEGSPVKPSLLQRIKDGAHHYVVGTKLLAYETQISMRLMGKILRGESLIRREYIQLVRTTKDIVRLVPFVIIMIVPFLEFALPVILRFFPNMLPSTFENSLQAQEKIRKQLKIKIETAKFLKDMSDSIIADKNKSEKIRLLFSKLRSKSSSISPDEAVILCSGLSEEISLEGMSRIQLQSISKFMSLGTYGTDRLLRYQIKNVLRKLKNDDVLIMKEGIESLSDKELKTACHERGINTIGVSVDYMKSELDSWIKMHVIHSIPAPILILSKALSITNEDPIVNSIQATVASLPKKIVEKAIDMPHTFMNNKPQSSEDKMTIIVEEEMLIDNDLKRSSTPIHDKSIDDNCSSPIINNIVLELATGNLTNSEKKELDTFLKGNKSDVKLGSSDDPTVKLIDKQVNKIVKKIDVNFKSLEEEVKKRLSNVMISSEGVITTDQLKTIIGLIRKSPKTTEYVESVIKSFDRDGDGKVFIRDILAAIEETKNCKT